MFLKLNQWSLVINAVAAAVAAATLVEAHVTSLKDNVNNGKR